MPNKGGQAYNNANTNGVSNSTTVGMNSQNASRPGSAIKKVNGNSPGNMIKVSKIGNLHGNEYKNLLFFNNNKINDSKDKILSI